MNINDIHNNILIILDKEQQGFVTHDEIDRVLDISQMALFNTYFNNPKSAQQGQTYWKSQRIDDSLSPFKEKFTFASGGAISSTGVITLPVNFMNLLSLYTTVYNSTLARNIYSAVQVLNEEELIERLESQVIPVTSDDPIAIMNKNNQIQLFPESAQSGGIYYLRRPVKPVFGYTQVGRVVTYNSGTSTQLEWKQDDINNIIVGALSYLGVNLSANDIVEFAELKNKDGQ
jgi:hypothetical protein